MKAALIVATLLAALPLAALSQKPMAPPPNLPTDLSQAEISKGIAGIKSRIDSCAARSQVEGTVTVSVTVAGSGAVEDVKVKSSPDGALGACVVNAVKKAAFGRSLKGATFPYSFKF